MCSSRKAAAVVVEVAMFIDPMFVLLSCQPQKTGQQITQAQVVSVSAQKKPAFTDQKAVRKTRTMMDDCSLGPTKKNQARTIKT
jgi:hypothetical protein